jgi:transcription initiation factor TFIIB
MWLEKLNQTSKLLRIPAHTAKLADNYFKSVFWEDPFRYKREALIPGCIYAACRKENVPLTLKQLSDCCYKSVPEIGRAFKLLVKELTLELPVVHREQIVETMCNQVGIPETIVSKVIGTARRLCGLLDEIGMSDHKGANLLAGVCIAIAWQAKEPTKNGKVSS